MIERGMGREQGNRKIRPIMSDLSLRLATVVSQASEQYLRTVLDRIREKGITKRTVSKSQKKVAATTGSSYQSLGPRTNGHCDYCQSTRAHQKDCPVRTGVYETKPKVEVQQPTIPEQTAKKPTGSNYVPMGPRTNGKCNYCGASRAHRKECQIRTGKEIIAPKMVALPEPPRLETKLLESAHEPREMHEHPALPVEIVPRQFNKAQRLTLIQQIAQRTKAWDPNIEDEMELRRAHEVPDEAVDDTDDVLASGDEEIPVPETTEPNETTIDSDEPEEQKYDP